ncbi:MAG: exodeoxyribonuclease III [Cyclobacteriaceae bacterium]|nr:exodeoxyribonuclease III [Cyclobacteriaceae bacterium]MCH8515319.1 exodeoxyribonuclease III [Cyclobacteriaceae bacterium]
MKCISYNVNGIRAAVKKGFAAWLADEKPDIIGLQELKAQEDQIDRVDLEALGYNVYLHPAEKKGYSGVGILSKVEPKKVTFGSGNADIDREGRIILADYDNFSFMSVYIPSGSSKEERQEYKMEWLAWFEAYVKELLTSRKSLIIAGDYNICHRPIDIHDPIRNKNSSGFLPEEREWVDRFLEIGFTDTFRMFHPEGDRYSWWSYRANARNNNKGWRIDYQMVSEAMKDRIIDADILDQVKHSDHCPISLKLNI